jgi:hypothetical protein
MGTRSLVHIKDGKKTIATIYRQHDGYPTGMGEDIKEILNNGKVEILNGYGGSSRIPEQFNGMCCIAAFLVGVLKQKKIGNVYLYPANSKDCGEEYVYTLSIAKGILSMKVFDTWNKKTLYNGPLNKFCGQRAEGKTPVEIALS